jgi:hypothetical protein
MKTVLSFLVFSFVTLAHCQIYYTVRSSEHSGVTPPYATVYVKQCDRVETNGKMAPYLGWVQIYSDKRLTDPLPNPVVVGKSGRYLFYTYWPYFTLEIVDEKGVHAVFRNCSVP